MPTRGRLAALGWGLAGVMEHQIVASGQEGGNRRKIPEYNPAWKVIEPHGHSDQGLRGLDVRAILCGIGSFDKGRHHKLTEAEKHGAKRQKARSGEPEERQYQIPSSAYVAVDGCVIGVIRTAVRDNRKSY